MSEITGFKRTDGGRSASGFTQERNDCTVRAIAVACDVPYPVAHEELKRRGRRDGKGAQFLKFVESNPVFCGKRLVMVYDRRQRNGKCICLCTAQKMFPKGRYIIRKSAHAFAMVDGIQIDSGENSKWIMVRQMWRVVDTEAAVAKAA